MSHGTPAHGAPIAPGHQLDPFDALADLFLGEPLPRHMDKAVPATGAPAAAPPEHDPGPSQGEHAAAGLVVVGHLPVLASAWVVQYARDLARAGERDVAVLTLGAAGATLELIADAPRSTSPRVLHTDLAEAAAEVARRGARWLVRCDHPDARPGSLIGRCADLTVLTSADDAGVVGAYRHLKALAPTLGGDAAPAVRIGVMGAAEGVARRVWLRLQEAVETFLGLHVELATIQPRIASGAPPVTTYRGPRMTLSEALDVAGSAPRPAGRTPPPSAPPAPDATIVADAPDVTLGQPRADAGPPAAPASGGPAPGLWSHVEGARRLAVRCPIAPDVQFAVDRDGRCHALAEAPATGDPSAAVAQLLAAGAWARQNHELILLAAGHDSGRPEADATRLHLFTVDAPRVRPLLDTDLRVHLRRCVHAGGAPAWLTAELN